MRLLAGIVFLLPACYLAGLAGRFRFFLWDLRDLLRCSQGYIDPRSRLLFFQLPILTLTAVAVLLLPHWGLSALAIVLVVAARQTGIAYGRKLAVRNHADYLVTEKRLDPSAALGEARETIAAIVKMNQTLRGRQ